MRIALIHAVAVAMPPIEAAFRRLWPEAERMNLLDDRLSVDRAKADAIAPATSARIGALADYAADAGARAILFTCSAFGPAIETVARRLDMPVLKPNEAMFEAAMMAGDRIGMIATFEPSVSSMEAEFRDAVLPSGRTACRLETICVPAAMQALQNGDAARHNELVADAARRLLHCDAIMLAQFSTSQAAGSARDAVTVPILTSPEAAVEKLKRVMTAKA